MASTSPVVWNADGVGAFVEQSIADRPNLVRLVSSTDYSYLDTVKLDDHSSYPTGDLAWLDSGRLCMVRWRPRCQEGPQRVREQGSHTLIADAIASYEGRAVGASHWDPEQDCDDDRELIILNTQTHETLEVADVKDVWGDVAVTDSGDVWFTRGDRRIAIYSLREKRDIWRSPGRSGWNDILCITPGGRALLRHTPRFPLADVAKLVLHPRLAPRMLWHLKEGIPLATDVSVVEIPSGRKIWSRCVGHVESGTMGNGDQVALGVTLNEAQSGVILYDLATGSADLVAAATYSFNIVGLTEWGWIVSDSKRVMLVDRDKQVELFRV